MTPRPWDGGWDSTFRVADLVLTYRRTVRPIYVKATGRTNPTKGPQPGQRERRRRPGEVLCINDVGSSRDRLSTDRKILNDVLVSEFSEPSRYEKLD